MTLSQGAAVFLLCAGSTVGRAQGSHQAIIAAWGDARWQAATCAAAQGAECRTAADADELAASIARYQQAGKSLRVILAPGVHRLAGPLRISDWGAGSNGAALVIEGVGGARAVLAGSLTVPRGRWHTAAPMASIGAAAAANVRVVNYAELTGRSAAGVGTAMFGHELQSVPVNLIWDGRPMIPARWPRVGYGTIAQVTPDGDQSLVRFTAPGPHRLPPRGAVIAGYPFRDWGYERIPVTASPDGDGAVIAAGSTALGVRAGQRVRIENSLAELDSPGEWVFDAASQDLYFWPAGGADADALEVVVAESLLQIKNSRNVRITGVDLENTLGDAIDVDGSSMVTIDHVAIRNTANRAVAITGGDHVSVEDSLLEDIGAGGIYIYGGDRRALRPGAHRVARCEIRRFGLRIKTYQPGIRLEGVGNAAVSNFIHDGPHSAILFSGNDELIEANHIANVVLESDDAGAIYTGRDWTARGSIVRNNFVMDIQGMAGAHQAVGLYLDDQASGTLADGNLFVNVGVGILVGGGRDNVIRNNVFVNDRSSIAVDARGVTWQRAQTQDHSGTLWTTLAAIPVDSPVYRQKYPRLAALRGDDPGTPKYDEFHWNLFVASGGIDVRDAGYFTWTDAENLRVGADVLKSVGIPANTAAGYDLDRTKLPRSWGGVYPSRQPIPN